MNIRLPFLIAGLVVLLAGAFSSMAQSKIKSVPFAYRPDASEDRYNQRLPHKTLAITENDFVILSRKTDTEFAIERYNNSLEKSWVAPLPLMAGESVDGFAKNEAGILVLTNRSEVTGAQILIGHLFDSKTGRKLLAKNP